MSKDLNSHPSPTEGSWKSACPEGKYGIADIDIWLVSVDLNPFAIQKLVPTLSSDEKIRADRFRFEKDRSRFITARASLRALLGSYLDKAPGLIQFEYTSNGKPRMVESGKDVLFFNLAHAGGRALIGISRERQIGIDLEPHRNDISMEVVAQHFFSAKEIKKFQEAPDESRAGIFFNFWTRKEALLKGTGKGLSAPAHMIEVSDVGNRGPIQISLPEDEPGGKEWYVQDLFIGTGWSAAVAADGSDWSLDCHEYKAQL